MSRPLLHYGSMEPIDIWATLCGAPLAPGVSATFRPYELEQENHEKMPYLFDTDACRDCYEKLIWRGDLEREQAGPLDIRSLDS